MTAYQEAKSTLVFYAKQAKTMHKGDKPLIRQVINDYTDSVIMAHDLSNYQKNLLHNYAAKLADTVNNSIIKTWER